jgi:hypothetical protein
MVSKDFPLSHEIDRNPWIPLKVFSFNVRDLFLPIGLHAPVAPKFDK